MSGDNGPALEAALYRHPSQEATIVASASRRLFRVNMAPEALIDGLAARGGNGNGHGTLPAGGDLDGVIAALRADGCLGAAPETADWLRFNGAVADPGAASRTSLAIVGEGRLASLLDGHDLLGRFRGSARRELAELDALDGSSVVVAVSDRLDYELLTEVEDRSATAGFRWMRNLSTQLRQ